MVDETRAPIEDEAPVNPYSLLAAVNDSSKDAHMAWLIFLGLMSYLILAVAGVSHKDLLLNSDVPLPILQVKIELTRFFLFAPLVLVLLHLGVMLQHVLLARKTIEFDRALAQLEPTSKRSHPLRLELQNFFFVQALAGPERSPIMSMFLHVMAWLTLVVLPVILIIYIQIVFLPYHHVTITWAHRISLLADIVMLVAMGVFLVRSETSFFSAFWRTGRHHPVSVMSTTVVLILVTLFSFFVATVPDEAMDRLSQSLPGASRTAQADSPGTGNLMGFVMPFLGATSDGSLFGIFRRNLEVSDTDLVVDKDIVPGERTLSLRGRDLRYARLDRSDLQQVDLTGANLDGASLIGTDLRRAWLGCANPALLQDTGNRPLAGCTRARKADFTRAKLDGARLGGIDLSDATLAEAILEQAELSNSVLVGANFASARLGGADLGGGAEMQRASFLYARLQGTDFTGGQLQFADFSSAGMQGVIMAHANLMGASFLSADLQGASLYKARLQGADFGGAKLTGVDLRDAVIWETTPPHEETAPFADFTDITLKPLGTPELASLKIALEQIGKRPLTLKMKDKLAILTSAAESARWAGSSEEKSWQKLVTVTASAKTPVYKGEITDFLGKLGCLARWNDGFVGAGVIKRALSPRFKGDMPMLYDKLRATTCAASRSVLKGPLARMAVEADSARGN